MENKENKSELVIYQTEDGQAKLQVKMEDETVWLTQDQMAELFQKAKSTINEHIKNIYEEKELTEEATTKKFGISEFSTKPTKKKMPEKKRKDAIDKINKYLYNRVPSNLRKEIGFLVKAQYNRITVSEKRPLFGDSLQASCVEVFQARFTDFDNRWHLYWMRKFHKWRPYVPKKAIYTVKDYIREVDKDGWGCFWG